MQGWQSDIWTALPGIVQSFDNAALTCVVQPAIRFKITDPALRTYSSPTMSMDPSGQYAWDQMPLLLDCPVVFPGGGGVTLTFPIRAGDEVLVILASRCIDAWWAQGGIQNQAMMRMHDLSDGFVLPAVRSQPNKFTASTSNAQLRTDDGTVSVSLNPTTHAIAVATTGAATVSAGSATVTAATIQLTGNVTVTGNLSVSGTMTNNGTNIGKTHQHSGVTAGGSNTGAPI